MLLLSARRIATIALFMGAAGCPLSDEYVIREAGSAPAEDGGLGAAGGGGAAPAGQGGAGGVDPCASLPPPEQVGCPAQCTAGCSGHLCRIDCTEAASCHGMGTVQCPEGWPCRVRCVGDQVCKDIYILCPDAYGCSVTCTGTQACQESAVQCGATGTCSLSCSDNQSCDNATLYCGGGGDCAATCAPQSDGDLPDVQCASGGCACTAC